MLFWGSIVTGAFQIGSWLARNTTSIETAMTAIGIIVGGDSLGADEGEGIEETLWRRVDEDGGNALPMLLDVIDAAEIKLEAEANVEIRSRRPSHDVGRLDAASKPVKLTGFWPTPNTQPGKSIPAFSSDINKLLTASRIPNTYKDSTGKSSDLGDYIARNIFMQRAQPGRINTALVPELRLFGNRYLHGVFSYYPVPLDSRGHDGWHGCLRLETYQGMMGSDAEDVEAPVVSRHLVRQSRLADGSDTQPQNVTTIRIVYSDVCEAEEFMHSMIDHFMNEEGIRIAQFPIIAGPAYVYKLESDPSVGNGEVCLRFTATVSASTRAGYKLSAMPEFDFVNNQVVDLEETRMMD